MPEIHNMTAIPLLVGATLSAFAGWRGMKIATLANVRTTTKIGVGVALANACEATKRAADHVTTATNDQDGVAEAIRKFVL